jgi:hypothetical protein
MLGLLRVESGHRGCSKETPCRVIYIRKQHHDWVV